MKIVVLGSRGMLGTDLMTAAREKGHAVLGLDQPAIDIGDYNNIWRHIPPCDWIINCAAYTNVDRAETHPAEAFSVNSEGALNVALVALRKKVRLLHISTDYVFDGHRRRPYSEKIHPNPINVYGASKLAGEKNIRGSGCSYIIVRTQSLFGLHGHNFVKAILNQIAKGERDLKVVMDQISSPTYTAHLAQGLLKLLEAPDRQILHLSATGSCSWYDFARAIVEEVHANAQVIPIPSSDIRRHAKRPAFSVLDNRTCEALTGYTMPTWEQGLREYLKGEKLTS
ncbi:MAG TPA: dTDP-4-dehydrorhamnose reductase [Kiritimatiellia bacterium]|nr:dTDP-4-dehydrorhamnose reductase [Kiritimatiellia bacterium]HQQ05102.1 dTDP-4-dehydrorhamnose reductase [Kiritimatiellia bacterium]